MIKETDTQKDFWFKMWQNNTIGFHKSDVNPSLVIHFAALSLAEGSRVFVPLCGKTLDIAWLLSQGYRVIGAELVEEAVEQLFLELGVKPKKLDLGDTKHYSAPNLEVFVGDIFDVTSKMLGSVDAVYDRAALVALPEPARERYAAHLVAITGEAPQLLITYEYDQRLLDGPPFSVSSEEVGRLYGGSHTPLLTERMVIHGGLKGKCSATKHVWVLQR